MGLDKTGLEVGVLHCTSDAVLVLEVQACPLWCSEGSCIISYCALCMRGASGLRLLLPLFQQSFAVNTWRGG